MTADYHSSLSIFNSAYMIVTIKCILYYNNDTWSYSNNPAIKWFICASYVTPVFVCDYIMLLFLYNISFFTLLYIFLNHTLKTHVIPIAIVKNRTKKLVHALRSEDRYYNINVHYFNYMAHQIIYYAYYISI